MHGTRTVDDQQFNIHDFLSYWTHEIPCFHVSNLFMESSHIPTQRNPQMYRLKKRFVSIAMHSQWTTNAKLECLEFNAYRVRPHCSTVKFAQGLNSHIGALNFTSRTKQRSTSENYNPKCCFATWYCKCLQADPSGWSPTSCWHQNKSCVSV